MHTLLKVASGILCAGLTLASSAAGARVKVGASISDVQFGVIDLTPDDGHAAGIVTSFRGTDLKSTLYASPPEAENITHQHHASTLSPFATHVSQAYGDTSASQSGAWGVGTAQLQLDNQLGQPRDAESSLNMVIGIAILPHTALSISGRAAGWTSQSRADSSSMFTSAVGYTRAYLDTAPTFPDGELGSFSKGASIGAFQSAPNFSNDFLLSYSNTGDSVRNVYFSVYLLAQASSSLIPAVPEPSSYAMLGAGLLLLGAIRRKA
ncbi:hypothetical protein AAKU55_004225 [Oxalobacteraceae bacterium GrIS 1.11]